MFSSLNPLPYLPQYPGKHRVGTSEVEIPISEIPSTSAAPDATITTIKFRLYYPTTPDAKSKQTVYWLPEPQRQWNDAYASFMGADPGWRSSLTINALSMWNYAKLPIVKDAPLLAPLTTEGRPLCIFSHGLGGNFNTYSSIVGSLASCGVVCVAPEHRDGSAPISFIRNAQGNIETSVPYQKHSHAPSTEVLNARNAQLRVRMWELELTYAAIKAMSEGKSFTNYATIVDEKENDQWKKQQQMFKRKLNLQPGQVTWAGHSFGAATTTQFVKSVFYHQHVPEVPYDTNKHDGSWDRTPLYKATADSDLVRQITADSPVALLDLWTMPLRGEATKWLWEKPMPSYYRKRSGISETPSVVAIVSAEFYRWTDLLNRTRALLSQDPVAAIESFERRKSKSQNGVPDPKNTTRATNPIPELSKQTPESADSPPTSGDTSRTPSPSPSASHSHNGSASSSSTSLVSSIHDASKSEILEPHLYHIPQSAHLSQSDFGVLFPNLTKFVMKAIEPEKTLHLNTRAILAVMKGRGLPVESFAGEDDDILDDQQKSKEKEARWLRVPLVDA